MGGWVDGRTDRTDGRIKLWLDAEFNVKFDMRSKKEERKKTRKKEEREK
jgi:hypothetical protein